MFLTNQDVTDNGNVAMFLMGDELYTSTETCNITHINTSNLKTVKTANYLTSVAVSLATAHPHTAREDGTVYNMGNTREKASIFKVIVVLILNIIFPIREKAMWH